MQIDPKVGDRIIRNARLSLLIYALPVLLMFITFAATGQRPWAHYVNSERAPIGAAPHVSLGSLFRLDDYGLIVFVIVLGAIEATMGLYERRWSKNERILDITCFVLPRFIIGPLAAWYSLKLLPILLPDMKHAFEWVPFGWAFLIICIADDLTQYWYHRLHHEIPWLWRFHRTHHSASYMGMAMASRQNFIYTVFFSQTWLTAALVYFGLGPAAVTVRAIKSIITTLAHSSIPWDAPLYRYKVLHPIAWLVERLISTPATHHAHHAATTDDGIGFYKGNFGNMFFLWDVMFGTAQISRRYPAVYGISHYEGDEWYAQLLWPILKSKVPGSELAAGGPVVREDTNLTTATPFS
jgi:sterol desaturase/sphingolipid hydroxylase (fatty acid hydroxylase superfamily)